MKRVLITGASGFIGKALVDSFHEKDIEITIVTQSSPIDMSHRFPYARIIHAAMIDYASLRETLQGQSFDCVYHLAWEGSTGSLRQHETIQRQNMKSSLLLYQISCDLHIKRFIAIGTISEHLIESHPSYLNSHPHLWYAWAKHETYVRLSQLSRNQSTELIWAQLPNVYGPDNTSGNLISYILQTLQNGQELSFTKAEQPYDFIHISDVVEALFMMGSFPKFRKNLYYIGSGASRKLKDFITHIIKAYGFHGDMGFGKRHEDHLMYQEDWFDHVPFAQETGFQVSKTFEEHMASLMDAMRG